LQNISQQLNCFGVIPTTTIALSKSIWSPKNRDIELPEMFHIKNHRKFKCRLLLHRRLQSVQISVNTVLTKYRRVGQVTGLLFRSGNSSYPELLGQLTGIGKTYDLDKDEWIIDLKVTTTKPLCRQAVELRPRLSQVEGIAIVTNRRRIEWDSEIPVDHISDTDLQKVSEITWEFNTIWDRV